MSSLPLKSREPGGRRILHTDFLIVGASVAGSALAMGLSELGYRVCLVEQELEPADHFKGEYLQPFAHQFLSEIGFSEALASGSPVDLLRFRDLSRANTRVSSEGRIFYPAAQPALAIRYLQLVSGMRKVLREKLGGMFFEGAELVPDNPESFDFEEHPLFTLRMADGQKIAVRPRIVIGCDGRQSKTRSWIKGPRPVKKALTVFGAPTEFIVGCEIKNTLDDPREYQVIRSDGDGTLSVFALSPEHCRVYWSAPAKFHKELGASPRSVWTQKIEKLFVETSGTLGLRLEGPVRPVGMPAFTAWYGPAQHGRFFLAGDSLAVTTPFGGQGMTCACLHAQALIEAFRDGIPSDYRLKALGRSYEKKTRAMFAHFNFLNTGIYHLFFSRNKVSKLATQHVLRSWEENPEIVDRLGRLFGGIDRDSPQISEVFELWGLPFPDIYPLRASSSKIELHRLLVPLMKLSNQAVRVTENSAPISKIRQQVFDFDALAKLRSLAKPAAKDISSL